MKTTIKIISGVLMVALVLSAALVTRAQEKKGVPTDTDFHFYIANETRIDDSQIEFDLLLLNTNPASSFELGTVQAGILVNPSLGSKGTVTASIVPGSSTLDPSQVPAIITFVQKKSCIKIAPKSPPGIGSGSVISIDPQNPSRLCRVRLTNPKGFGNASSEIRFCLNSKPYPTKISRYAHETGLNTPMTVNAYTCFTQKEQVNQGTSAMKTTLPADAITIYPNPNNGSFTLGIKSESQVAYDLQVRNELGTMLYEDENFEVKGNTNKQIDLKNLPDGNYTLVLSRVGEIISKKLVIKH